ncbi:unnamed protein product [Moneuplotes crassus]|uniref:Uncharacterized protein n=1 Tax=Euplotes crassus TaxID=5936 RepID=A0AAD2D4Z7_EUPCR|nr:unnamed protein product [Moneuplotes crassus]
MLSHSWRSKTVRLSKLSQRPKTSKISSLMSSIQKSRESRNDFNTQYSQLSSSKIDITLRDIWVDYSNFKKAYLYHPKLDYEEKTVVDPTKFSLVDYMKTLLADQRPESKFNVPTLTKMFSFGIKLCIFLVVWKLVLKKVVWKVFHLDNPYDIKVIRENRKKLEEVYGVNEEQQVDNVRKRYREGVKKVQ